MNMIHKKTTSGIHYFISDNTIDRYDRTILFIHPAFTDHHSFDDQIAFFSQDYRVLTMDLLGHGLSQGFKTNQKIDDTYKHIHELLVMEKIDQIHLVGVSIGSLLAQDFANRYPQMVLSLSSLGGYDVSNYDQSIEKAQKKQQVLFMLKALFSIKLFSKSNAKVSAYTKTAQEKFYQMNCHFKRRSFGYLSTLGNIMNQEQSIHSFPLLIMVGEHDIDIAKTLANKWAVDTNSQLHTIQDAGHCANMDNPKDFNYELKQFIDESNI